MRLDIYSVRLVKDKSLNGYQSELKGSRAVFEIVNKLFELQTQPVENFIVLCLDTRNKICGVHKVSEGNLNTTIVHPREIFQRALMNNANSILLVHNHPSGSPEPSADDIEVTKMICKAGELMGIPVVDHVVIGDGCYTSMVDKGCLH